MKAAAGSPGILAALDIIETKRTITKHEDSTISFAISSVNVNLMRSYDLRTLEHLIENLPVIDVNLPLINAAEQLINRINSNVDKYFFIFR